MDSLDPIDLAPLRIEVGDDPPRVLLGPVGGQVDVRPSVEGLVIHLLPEGCFVTLTVRADVADFAFAVREVTVARPGAGAEEITAEEIDQAILAAGYGASPGEAVARHLRMRLGSGS